ncbi:dipicolinate synthase subunit B [Herbinix luporum]|jgi:dipicolinate synthase subunit B|uniref:Dipicolinate synthase subunit B n=1 Tax=Herbinix luporum TaxID=1679721 RepID=A0A0K8J2W0_9FIRM|nr:dipicolinate synthase subunit B [Herbinix luporum]MDI9489037.1 dipicolinate synthase subunit B [Bacillota bacterium]CUH91981.1 Dipicolinate synthase subunit B [Herbinix luporum]HHT56498.1 dipicolinate synthase subunit B [Herbinix luporum]
MKINEKNIGIAFTGSYCTFDRVFPEVERLVAENANVYTIFSDQSQTTDTRFGKAADFLKKAKEITGKDPITTIVEAEKLGPNNILDIIVIAPCTGNTLAKMANAITDSPVLMAAKGLLRNNKPVVIAISSNDALSNNLKNIGLLINTKNIYFVPFSQDNYKGKPHSMVAHFDLILPTIEFALENKQLQPLILAPA